MTSQRLGATRAPAEAAAAAAGDHHRAAGLAAAGGPGSGYGCGCGYGGHASLACGTSTCCAVMDNKVNDNIVPVNVSRTSPVAVTA